MSLIDDILKQTHYVIEPFTVVWSYAPAESNTFEGGVV